jgi:hypothetical protein
MDQSVIKVGAGAVILKDGKTVIDAIKTKRAYFELGKQ